MDTPTSHEVPAVAGPALIEQNQHPGRSYLARAFKYQLLCVPAAVVSSIICLLSMISYWKEHPRHFCHLTDHCQDLLAMPLILSGLTFCFAIPALFILDHFMVSSPIVDHKDPAGLPVDVDANDSQSETEPHPARVPEGGSIYTRIILHIFTFASYTAALLWLVSCIAAITSAVLIIKYDSPFDNTDTRFKERVFLGLGGAAFNVLAAALMVTEGVLCSRARQSITARAGETSSHPGQPDLANSSLTDRIQAAVGSLSPRKLWDQRTKSDKVVFIHLITLLLLAVCSYYHAMVEPAGWRYFSGFFYFFTVVLVYPFVFVFHRYRTDGVVPGAVGRVLTCFIFAFLSAFWFLMSVGFLGASLCGLFWQPGTVHGPLICPYGQFGSFEMGILDMILAAFLGTTVYAAWKSGVGIQLAVDTPHQDDP